MRTLVTLSQVAPVADFPTGFACLWFFSRLHKSTAYFSLRLRPFESLKFFSGRARCWLFFQSAHLFWLFPRSLPLLIFPQVTHIADFFSSSHESVADFFFRLRPSLTFFRGRARCLLLFHVARIADFFPGRASSWFFHMLRMSQIFFRVARVPHWLPFQVADMAGFFPVCVRRWFFPKCACRWLFLAARRSPSLVSFSGCARGWFLPSWACHWLYCQLARVRRWLLFQVAPVDDIFTGRARCSLLFHVARLADFFTGRASRWLFPRLRMSQICFSVSHESLADFLFSLRTWLVIPSLRPWLIFPKMCLSLTFFGSPHKSVAGFFFRLRLSLISSKLNPSLTLLPARMSPSLTFFSSCAGRWHFSQVAPVVFLIHVARIADFFPGRASRWLFPRLSMSQIFFSVSHESLAGFLFRLRTWLVIPSLRPSLIFPKMCLSLTFFWQHAQVRRWFLFQVAPVADFFQVEPVADFIASSHDSVADFFFSLRRSLTFFTGRARCFF